MTLEQASQSREPTIAELVTVRLPFAQDEDVAPPELRGEGLRGIFHDRENGYYLVLSGQTLRVHFSSDQGWNYVQWSGIHQRYEITSPVVALGIPNRDQVVQWFREHPIHDSPEHTTPTSTQPQNSSDLTGVAQRLEEAATALISPTPDPTSIPAREMAEETRVDSTITASR